MDKGKLLMRTVSIFEHYRPIKEKDQMLIVVSNIDYVTEPKNSECLNPPVWQFGYDMIKMVIHEMDIRDIPEFINDFIHYNKIPQPANLSIYIMEAININYMPSIIRDLLENNLSR